ncbi:bromodomain-containing protein 9 [Capsicum galapagoense]
MGKVTTTIAKSKTTTKRETATATVSSSSSIAMEMKKRKKKKGRPSLADLSKRQNSNNSITNSNKNKNKKTSIVRRSSRRNPNFESNSPAPEFDEDEDDDEDEREEKKVKLVVRLPQHSGAVPEEEEEEGNSVNSDSDLEPEFVDNNEGAIEKRKISSVDRRSDDAVSDQEEKLMMVTYTQHESPLVSGPTTPLPDKKMLVFILDRLQKKDTYGVFSEPVDPNELPDYHEIIEHPMDFGTVRKKLDGGLYSNLEELEADVILICSNAMEYNATDTVYYRQARSIQDLAKRDFENLRHEGEDGAPQPKVVRRGRPPSKNLKKSVENSPIDRAVPEHSPGVTLASGGDKATGSNSYNLRKGPILSTADASFGHRSRNGESYSEWVTDWNNEFPANILRADMKYGKKHFSIDENRRDTYQQFHPSASYSEPSLLWNADGDMKRLMAVGVHSEQHAYARSLARFAANLGPAVWKLASKKLENILPAGVKFGPGWVGEVGGPTESACPAEIQKSSLDSSTADLHSSRPVTPTPSGLSSAVMSKPSAEIFEALKRLNSQNELSRQGPGDGVFSWVNPASTSQGPQKPFLQPRNGFNGMFGHESSPQAELSRFSASKGQSGLQEASRPNQVLGMLPGRDNKLSESWATLYSGNSLAQGKNPDFCTEQNVRPSGESRPASSVQQKSRMSVPPDLNVQVQPPGSPSASLQIGSSQQPDLALQL